MSNLLGSKVATKLVSNNHNSFDDAIHIQYYLTPNPCGKTQLHMHSCCPSPCYLNRTITQDTSSKIDIASLLILDFPNKSSTSALRCTRRITCGARRENYWIKLRKWIPLNRSILNNPFGINGREIFARN